MSSPSRCLLGTVGLAVFSDRCVWLCHKVFDVKESRAVKADIDEGGLHAWQHPGYLPYIHVTDGGALLGALDIKLGEDAFLDESNAGLSDVYIY